jgi:DNA-binding GntR family transcriptional regulator
VTSPTPVAGSTPRGGVKGLVDTVREQIISGVLEPGERLTEERLAADFGVSRIPVREAIRALASEGFVSSERYGGTFVADVDAEAAHDLLHVRAVLEALAAVQAALRCNAEEVDSLYELLEDGERAVQEKRYENARTIKGQFYEQLAVFSENDTLISLVRIVRSKIEWATSIDAMRATPDELRRDRIKLMRVIVDAIAEHDAASAADAVLSNIDATYTSQGWKRVVDTRYDASVATMPRSAG